MDPIDERAFAWRRVNGEGRLGNLRASMGNHEHDIVLWVDDDSNWVNAFRLAPRLRELGLKLVQAKTMAEAVEHLEECRDHADSLKVVILDIYVDLGELDRERYADLAAEAYGGQLAGLALANWIREIFPATALIGLSFFPEDVVTGWFQRQGFPFYPKSHMPTKKRFVEILEGAARGERFRPRPFIVHGHDKPTRMELQLYLQNTLHLDEPVVLVDRPSKGLTIVEKFEKEAIDADLVFVLLTPDDQAAAAKDPDTVRARARQNVIFELGYFYGKLGRKSGRVFLLYKSEVELPSDISGVVTIDIANGVEAAGEKIRQELEPWLHLK